MENNFFINGKSQSGNIILNSGNTYVLSGNLSESTITIVDNSSNYVKTTLKLNNVKIHNNDKDIIVYNSKNIDNDLDIILEKNTKNTLYVAKKNFVIMTNEGVIDTNCNLSLLGVGYITIYNSTGYGLKGNKTKVCGPHIHFTVKNSAIYGDYVYYEDGISYFSRAHHGIYSINDSFVFNGNMFNLTGLYNGPYFSKANGYVTRSFPLPPTRMFVGKNIVFIESYFNNTSKIIAYKSHNDYVNKINGVIVNDISNNYNIYELSGTFNKQITINNDVTLYLNNVLITSSESCLVSNSQVTLIGVKDSINMFYNENKTYDAISINNTLKFSSEKNSYIYIKSLHNNGVIANDIIFENNIGDIMINSCGKCGIKGNNVFVTKSCTGNIVCKDNMKGDNTQDYVDVYCVNKITIDKNTGICIMKSMGAKNIDCGNNDNLYVNIFRPQSNIINKVNLCDESLLV